MIQQSYEVIVSKIISATSLPKEEIEQKIQKKINDLQDLISRNGAAHIVANELGVKLFDLTPQILKIADILPGMQSITITAKVMENYGAKTFQSASRQGRVLSLMLGDETGTIRASIWDEAIISQAEAIKTGDIVKISNAYSKQNTLNSLFKDLHLGNRAQITINPEGVKIEAVKLNVRANAPRKQILDLVENEFVEILGTVVQVFEPHSYSACPVCNKKVISDSAGTSCIDHGIVTPKQAFILNAFIDDGSSNIRVAFFRDLAEKLINNQANIELLKKELLGKQFIIRGKTVLNQMFNRLEFNANSLEEAEPAKLIAEIETVSEH